MFLGDEEQKQQCLETGSKQQVDVEVLIEGLHRHEEGKESRMANRDKRRIV